MKKVLSFIAVTGLVAASTAAFGASIVNSKHNLTAYGTGDNITPGTSTQICVYCHAPHNARFALPLWNRTDATGPFRLYSGVNMQNQSFASGFTADSTSLFCMSCHDGTTKMNAVHNAGVIEGDVASGLTHAPLAGVFSGSVLTGAATLGAKTADSLTKTHPINFPVSTTDGQKDLNVGSGSVMGPGVVVSTNGYPYTFGVTFPLFKTTDGRGGANSSRMLECGSCHAVHDSTYSPFLRDTMGGSQLCLGCHNK